MIDRSLAAGFYLCPDFQGQGPRVFLISEAKWTSFLRSRAGLPGEAFYVRPRREFEPDTHPNGHPWAWLYKPEEALLDEKRWLSEGEFKDFESRLRGALAGIEKGFQNVQ